MSYAAVTLIARAIVIAAYLVGRGGGSLSLNEALGKLN